MKRIFITAIGGDIGYGVIKSLNKGFNDLFLVGCDIQKYNYSYDLVDKFYVSPSYANELEWIEFVINVLNVNNIDYFFPITEAEIKIVDKNRDLFNSCKVIVNNSNVLKVALDKGKTANFLSENGINTPQTFYSYSDYNINFPAIIKERFGCGSHSIAYANDCTELKDKFLLMKDAIIQEIVGNPDDEYTMTIFSNGIIVNSIMFKRKLGFGGMSRYVELVHGKEVGELAYKIAKAFNLIGSINVQMRKVDNKYYVFEINPRISSSIGFRLQLGFNDVKWWIDLFNDNNIPQFETPKDDFYGVRNVEEKIFKV